MPRQKKQHLKQRKDGRYCCKYHGIQFMGNSEDEALDARYDYKRQEANGAFLPENTLFSVYAMRWLKAYKSHLTAAPYNTHARMLNRWIAEIGDSYLRDITPTDVSNYYQLFAGMSASTIHSARDTIKGLFKAALADGLIQKDPSANINPPKGAKGTHREITDEERALIHITDHRLRKAALVMLYAGLRRGEAMALNIDRDVDFQAMTITVREAVRFDSHGQPMIVKPKTQAGIRTVPMLEGLAAELDGLHGRLCASASGTLMTESAWERAWQSYRYTLGEKKNGCSRRWAKGPWQPVTIRAHDLRHSFCTMLYDSGVDLKTAMLWMGHADQTMTMQIYTHLTETRRKEAENSLRNAQKQAFGMQNGMQYSLFHVEPLKYKALPNRE
jgi:integrase